MGILYGKYAQGKNDLPSKQLFLERAFYKHYVEVNQGFPPLDLWESRHHYGRADYWHNAIYPSEFNLKQIPTKRGAIFALDFVADAFEGFRQEYRNLSLGVIAPNADTFFSGDLEPKRGWVSIHKEYHRHMTMLYTAFNGFIQISPERKQQMTNFDNFMKLLWQFFSTVLPAFPVTRTGFIYSKYCDPKVSGLIVEIMKLKHDRDLTKEYMIEDINFKAYAATAAKHGFYVDRNAPWRLIAKIGSLKLEKYMREYGITSLPPFTTIEESNPAGTTNFIKKNVSINEMIARVVPNPTSTSVSGETTMNEKHNHVYSVDKNGNGYAHYACHEKFPEVCHRHIVENWVVLPANSKYIDPNHPMNSADELRGIGDHNHTMLPPKEKPSYKSENSYENIFKRYFYTSYLTDIETLKVYAMSFYNSFVNANQFIRIPETDWCSAMQTTKPFYKKVKGVSKEEITLKYKLPYWMRMYMKIRAQETDQPLQAKTLDHLMKRVEFQIKYRSVTDALHVANSFFQGTINPSHTPVKDIKLAGYNPGITNHSTVNSPDSGQSYINEVNNAMADSMQIIEEIKKKHHGY